MASQSILINGLLINSRYSMGCHSIAINAESTRNCHFIFETCLATHGILHLFTRTKLILTHLWIWVV
jgi:hypothetical protein